MFIEFKTHPAGTVVTINTAQVTTVGPDPKHPGMTLIRFSDGREIVVAETPEQVMARTKATRSARRPKGRLSGPGRQRYGAVQRHLCANGLR